MNRTNLINYIIEKMEYYTYLEIGIGTGKNFEAVKVKKKIGVDPDPAVHANVDIIQGRYNGKFLISNTSDQFFEWLRKDKLPKHDIIFIDGLHHADQVRRDIINAWECLTDGGCLVIHDTNPDREEITQVPRATKEWTGDVYKAIHQIDGPPKFTLKDDHGVTVIRKTGPLVMSDGIIEWEGFDLMREAILHLVTWDEAIKIIDGWT